MGKPLFDVSGDQRRHHAGQDYQTCAAVGRPLDGRVRQPRVLNARRCEQRLRVGDAGEGAGMQTRNEQHSAFDMAQDNEHGTSSQGGPAHSNEGGT